MMSTDKESRSAASAVPFVGWLSAAFLVALGLVAWSAPELASKAPPAPNSVQKPRPHLDHTAQLPDAPLTELGAFSELDLEEEDDKDPDEFTRKPQRQQVTDPHLRTRKPLGLAELEKPTGHHNARGARSPPAA